MLAKIQEPGSLIVPKHPKALSHEHLKPIIFLSQSVRQWRNYTQAASSMNVSSTSCGICTCEDPRISKRVKKNSMIFRKTTRATSRIQARVTYCHRKYTKKIYKDIQTEGPAWKLLCLYVFNAKKSRGGKTVSGTVDKSAKFLHCEHSHDNILLKNTHILMSKWST